MWSTVGNHGFTKTPWAADAPGAKEHDGGDVRKNRGEEQPTPLGLVRAPDRRQDTYMACLLNVSEDFSFLLYPA